MGRPIEDCPTCQAPIRPEAKFCRSCGTALSGSAAGATGATSTEQVAQPVAATGSAATKSTPWPLVAGGLIGLLVVLIIALVMLASGGDGEDGGQETASESDATVPNVTITTAPDTTEPPTTTTTRSAVTTTTIDPLRGSDLGRDIDEAYEATADLAGALADGDWNLARALEPAKQGWTDTQFISAYGDLVASSPVFVRASNGHPIDVRIGLVAHQTPVGGGQQTTLYCVTWVVDLAGPTVTQVGSESSELTTMGGWVDPVTVVDRIRASC